MTQKDFDGMDPWTLGASMDEDENVGVVSPFISPDAVLADMKRVDVAMKTLDADVRANVARMRPIFVEAWDKFLSEWKEFFGSHSSGFGGWTSRLWGATHEQVVSYHNRVGEWRKGYEKEAGVSATGPAPEKPEGGLPWKWIVGSAMIVGGIVAIGYAARGIRGVAESI